MTHPSEETLNNYIERDLSPAEHVQVATHVNECHDCALIVAEIQQVVRDAAALGPITPPPHVWTRPRESVVDSRQSSGDSQSSVDSQSTVESQSIVDGRQAAVPRSEWWQWRGLAWAAATAALVVMAFFVGRYTNQRDAQSVARQPAAMSPAPAARVADDASVRERVLLIAVGDHLERSQMVLVELAHADTRGELDISAERQLADDLVASNRLYRQTAQQMGHDNVAGLLDELERVLVEVARGPSTVSMQQLADIQQRIESQGILFKVEGHSSEIRQ